MQTTHLILALTLGMASASEFLGTDQLVVAEASSKLAHIVSHLEGTTGGDIIAWSLGGTIAQTKPAPTRGPFNLTGRGFTSQGKSYLFKDGKTFEDHLIAAKDMQLPKSTAELDAHIAVDGSWGFKLISATIADVFLGGEGMKENGENWPLVITDMPEYRDLLAHIQRHKDLPCFQNRIFIHVSQKPNAAWISGAAWDSAETKKSDFGKNWAAYARKTNFWEGDGAGGPYGWRVLARSGTVQGYDDDGQCAWTEPGHCGQVTLAATSKGTATGLIGLLKSAVALYRSV